MKKGNLGKFKAFIILGLVLTLNLPSLAFIELKNPSVDSENLVQLMNSTSKHVKITGTICSSEISDNSKVIFLNFGKNFNTSLSAVIYDFDVHSFIAAGIDNPQAYFKNKKVVLQGVVRIANGKPEIVINSPKQIKIIE
ncbi:MAG: hypothetical protein A2039_04935 [Candidatus Melainabacteria bacterium GWA2_34_9]|nr:MAG: hypothetical protein A2039_04935 [Candidatus Melainabacteria bacterium GWA2_34_9]